MLVGHYAPALLARRLAPRAPLWSLLLAAQAVDLGFMLLGLVGIEGARLSSETPRLVVTSGVWTHSLPMTVVWGLALGGLAGLATRKVQTGVAVGLVVASHWFTDLLVHTPDLPLGFEQEPAVGLSLWLHPPWAMVLELVLLGGCAGLLVPVLPSGQRRRLAVLVAGLAVLQLLSELVIPTPTSFAALAASALGLYAAVAVAGVWVERGGASDGPLPGP